MTEYVFRPLRDGERSRLYSGRYTLNRGDKPRTVALGTPDKLVARTKLRKLIVAAQREAEGLVTPAPLVEAAADTLLSLLDEFTADLDALGRTPQHVHDTRTRIERILKECGWKRLRDIRADHFIRWRATLKIAAKTKKEYQAAINNLLNWLVRLDRLMVNPLKKLTVISTRGRQVRVARAFTPEELTGLFGVSRRRLVYQVLTYTGQRSAEVRALVWGDLHLDEDRPFALFREETMKDAAKRPIPLHPSLAAALRAAKPSHCLPDSPVFRVFPKWRTLMEDLKRLGIERKDKTGRVVHFHSFRKTFQTMGVIHGINQRAAQEFLGHSDANLTAKVYTDVPALALHSEIAKLPWIGEGGKNATAIRSLSVSVTNDLGRFRALCSELVSFSETLDEKQLEAVFELSKNGAAYGIRTRDP
jgi:integrase